MDKVAGTIENQRGKRQLKHEGLSQMLGYSHDKEFSPMFGCHCLRFDESLGNGLNLCFGHLAFPTTDLDCVFACILFLIF